MFKKKSMKKIWYGVLMQIIAATVIFSVAVGIYFSTDFIPAHLEKIDETGNYQWRENIEIHSAWTDNAKIYLAGSERDDIEIRRKGYKNERNRFTLSDSEELLSVESKISRKWYQYAFSSLDYDDLIYPLDIDFHLPQRALRNLTISSHRAVEITNIQADIITITGDDTIAVSDVVCNDLIIKNNSGTIRINNVSASNKITLNNSSGSSEIKTSDTDNLSISSSSGGVYLTEVEANTISVKNSSGKIQLNEVSAESASIKNSSGSIGVNNLTSAINSIVAQNSSGSIKVQTLFDEATLSNSSGSIKLYSYEVASKVKMTNSSGSVSFYADYSYTFYAAVSSGSLRNKANGQRSLNMEENYYFKTSSGNINLNPLS